VDSPGGLVDQIPETAAMIKAGREQKHVVAVANTLAASAAYWLSSQANEIVVSPSGEVGSIGVFAQHRDLSGALEQGGISVSLVSAGKYKTEGHPFGPLESEAREHIQQGVDDYYDLFVKDVASGRGASVKDVTSGFGEGRVLTAARSVKAGLADRVDTLDNVVAGLVRRSTATSAAADAVEVEYTSVERERLVSMAGTLDFSRIEKEGVPA
jgi:signal peptide peptidase SppA